jgi:hypothetical protein
MTDQEMLDAARTARHQLLLGAGIVECDFGGAGGQQRTKFTPADANKLDSYIAELEARIAGLPRRGAIGIVF